MWDWLRFLPITLSDSNGPVTPNGPYFPWMFKQKWQFHDSHFYLRCPIANPVVGDPGIFRKSRSPASGDITQYAYHNGEFALITTKERWHHEHFFLRNWLFVGAWFTGIQSSLKCSCSLVRPHKPAMFEGSSFFHPRVFENAIVDYLNSFFGHVKNNRKAHYRGPLNWKVINISDTIKAASVDIHVIGNTSKEHPKLRRLVFFPISHNQIVNFHFDFGCTIISGIDSVNPTPMLELADNVISTFKLNVGEKTLAEWNAVKAQCQDMSLTAEFGELKWPIAVKDIGKSQAIIDEEQAQQKILKATKKLRQKAP